MSTWDDEWTGTDYRSDPKHRLVTAALLIACPACKAERSHRCTVDGGALVHYSRIADATRLGQRQAKTGGGGKWG